MYDQRRNYAIVGLFVTAMTLAGVVALLLLTGRTGPTDAYYAVFDNVADVKYGTQVRFEGYPVGQVEAIAPVAEDDGVRFRVEMSLRRGWRIPGDSVASIAISSFLAAKTIEIRSGQAPQAVPPGGEIASAPSGDVFAVVATAAAEISELNRRGVRPLLETLNGLAETLANDAPRITAELSGVSVRVNRSLEAVEQILARDNVQAIGRTIGNIEETSGVLAATSRDLAATLSRIDSVANNLDLAVTENREAVTQSLRDVQYTLRSLAWTVDSIVHNVDGAARNMNEFSRLIRSNPGLLLDGSPRDSVSPASLPRREAPQ